MNFCPNCGQKLLKKDNFCGECGEKIVARVPVVDIPPPPPAPSLHDSASGKLHTPLQDSLRKTAWVWFIFLGIGLLNLFVDEPTVGAFLGNGAAGMAGWSLILSAVTGVAAASTADMGGKEKWKSITRGLLGWSAIGVALFLIFLAIAFLAL